jgi:outer membrane murein-binding lipoprotein Lpp
MRHNTLDWTKVRRILLGASKARPAARGQIFALAVGMLLLCSGTAHAERNISSLAASLARLRSEVETLSSQIETKKADLRARMRSLATQKAELETKIKREQLRFKQIAKRRRELKQKIKKRNERRSQVKPAVPKLAAILHKAIEGTLPFRIKDRKKEIDNLVRRFKDSLVEADVAVGQLWERVEDELRLGRESGLYKQVVHLAGQKHLVEVARIGMVMMFFRTRDDRYGMVKKSQTGWSYIEIKEKPRWLQVAALFDAFKKQIRTGFFVLPQPLGEGK